MHAPCLSSSLVLRAHWDSSLLAHSGCAAADMVFQILHVLDKSSSQVDYSGFGPKLPELPGGDAAHMQLCQSPDDGAPGSSTRLMLTEGTPSSETGLIDAQAGSHEGASLAQQAGSEITAIEWTQEPPAASA